MFFKGYVITYSSEIFFLQILNLCLYFFLKLTWSENNMSMFPKALLWFLKKKGSEILGNDRISMILRDTIFSFFWLQGLCWVFITFEGFLQLQRAVACLCRAQALGSQASGAVVYRLSCSATCGIFPDQGLNLCPQHWQADPCPLGHQGSPIFTF